MLFILFYLLAFFIYAAFFASPQELKFIGAKQIDKISHFLGGVFIAGAYGWICGRKKLLWLVVLLFLLTVGWELIEIFFFASVQYFYRAAPDLWRLDSAGDILAAALGGYGYWVFVMTRGNAEKPPLR